MTSTITEEATSGEQGADADLSELVGELPPLTSEIWLSISEGRMPGAAEIGEAMVTELLRVETRLQTARDMVELVHFAFDFSPDDDRSAQRAALTDLDEAGEILEKVKVAVLRWLKAVNSTRVVELDEETWPTLRELIPSLVPCYRGHAAALVVEAAVEYLRQQPDADWIVARAEQKRLAALRGDSGGKSSARRSWPQARVSGEPWPDNEADTSSESAKPEGISALADSGDSPHQHDSADEDDG